MVEILVAAVCALQSFSNNACGQAFNAYRGYNPYIHQVEKNFDRYYVQTLPDELKIAGGAAGVIYTKRLKIVIVHGLFVDFRDKGEAFGGYEFRF